jgi:hypothetical protein
MKKAAWYEGALCAGGFFCIRDVCYLGTLEVVRENTSLCFNKMETEYQVLMLGARVSNTTQEHHEFEWMSSGKRDEVLRDRMEEQLNGLTQHRCTRSKLP